MKKKGLTLVELLVVVSILAILAGIIYTVVGNIRWQVKFTRCMTHLKECGIALRMYAQDWNGFVPPFVSTHLSIDENLLKYFFPKANDPNLLANAFLNYSKSKEIWLCPDARKMGPLDPNTFFPKNPFTNYYIRLRYGTMAIPIDHPPIWVPFEIASLRYSDELSQLRCARCNWVHRVYLRWIYAQDFFHEYGWDGIGWGGPKFRITLFLTGDVRPVDERKFRLFGHPDCPSDKLENLPNIPIKIE